MPPPFCHNPELDAANRKPETTKARGRNRRAFGELVRLVPVGRLVPVHDQLETTKARGRNRRAFGDRVRLVPVHDHSSRSTSSAAVSARAFSLWRNWSG